VKKEAQNLRIPVIAGKQKTVKPQQITCGFFLTIFFKAVPVAAANQHTPHFISLQLELNYQRQLMNFRKRAGAGPNELDLIERRIELLMSQLEAAVRPASSNDDPGFFNSSGS
jgi:hypothetical protein